MLVKEAHADLIDAIKGDNIVGTSSKSSLILPEIFKNDSHILSLKLVHFCHLTSVFIIQLYDIFYTPIIL